MVKIADLKGKKTRSTAIQHVLWIKEGDLWIVEYTYLSAIEACFRNRRFPVEIIRPGRYMKIKSKHFG
jgi:hypothetical protein